MNDCALAGVREVSAYLASLPTTILVKPVLKGRLPLTSGKDMITETVSETSGSLIATLAKGKLVCLSVMSEGGLENETTGGSSTEVTVRVTLVTVWPPE